MIRRDRDPLPHPQYAQPQPQCAQRRGALARRLLPWAIMPVLCLLAVPKAFAYTDGVVEWLDFPQLKVASDGHQYTGVTGIGYGWEGRVDISSSGLPRVKSWSMYPSLAVEGLGSLSFKPYKAGKSYSFGKRPQNVHVTTGTLFPDVFVDEFAAAACNQRLEQLMSQGQSRAQVLAQQQVVPAVVWGGLDIDITVGDPLIEASRWDVQILCEKSPIQPPKPPRPGSGSVTTSGAFELVNAKLVIFPSTYSGECPKALTLFMTVEGSHAGTFEARIESTAGWKSTKTVLETNEFNASSGLWGRDFSDPFTVPVQTPKPGGGGGGIVPASGHLKTAQNPGDDVIPGAGGPPAAAGGLTAKDPGSNVHKQSLRLVAVANGKTVASDWQQYSVTCDPKPAIKPATQALLPGGTGGKPPKPGDSDPKPGKPKPKPAPARPVPSAPDAKQKPPTVDTAGSKAKRPSSEARSSAPKPASSLGKPTAESKIATPTARKVEATERPDLRVLGARRSAKDPQTIEFLVANGGKADAAKSSAQLTCARAQGGSESWSAAVPAIRAASERWVQAAPKGARASLAAVRGCEIRLDPGNLVHEADERNNAFSCTECKASPAARR